MEASRMRIGMKVLLENAQVKLRIPEYLGKKGEIVGLNDGGVEAHCILLFEDGRRQGFNCDYLTEDISYLPTFERIRRVTELEQIVTLMSLDIADFRERLASYNGLNRVSIIDSVLRLEIKRKRLFNELTGIKAQLENPEINVIETQPFEAKALHDWLRNG